MHKASFAAVQRHGSYWHKADVPVHWTNVCYCGNYSHYSFKCDAKLFAVYPDHPTVPGTGFAIDDQLKDPWHTERSSNAKASAARR
jgi:hypothetical protein